MSFLYPLGLLGFIGIPILILIYIIKNKYTEQTITSTYIWELSEKFLKNKKPISKLKGLISLILQCMIVFIGTLLVAHPVLHIPNSAYEYCFIFDGSASMNMTTNGKTYFDCAKEEIENKINSSANGSKYTLVYIGNSTRVVYEGLTKKEKAVELLDTLECASLANGVTDAIVYAQSYFDKNPSVKTILYTDKAYETENIQLVNVAEPFVNYAITDLDYALSSARFDKDGAIVSPASLAVTAHILSYKGMDFVSVSLLINGEKIETKTVEVEELEEANVEFSYLTDSFQSIEVVIDSSDSLELDNSMIVYNLALEHEYKALIVSTTPFYLESIIKAYGVSKVDIKKPSEYDSSMSGYGLYVFDGYSPEELPKDGTIWLFNQTGSIEKSGFSYKETVSLEEGAALELAKGASSTYKKLTENMLDLEMYIKTYNRYGTYRSFTSLVEVDGDPVIMSGSNSYGNREIVFAFDLHETNLPLSYNFFALFHNLLNYSFPAILEEANYECGNSLEINVVSGCKSIRVESPSKEVYYLDCKGTAASHTLTEIGSYKVIVNVGDDIKEFNVYSSYPLEENIEEINSQISLHGTSENKNSDGLYDSLIILFVCLSLLFIADWVVYCYEQYQLR